MPGGEARDRYFRSSDRIRRAGPGTRLRSERDLAAHYEVAYHTIRRAMEVLRERGLTVSIHSRGTFVREPPTPEPDAARFAPGHQRGPNIAGQAVPAFSGNHRTPRPCGSTGETSCLVIVVHALSALPGAAWPRPPIFANTANAARAVAESLVDRIGAEIDKRVDARFFAKGARWQPPGRRDAAGPAPRAELAGLDISG